MNKLPTKIEGNPKAPWLIFVNGLFASLESWNESVDFFTPHFHCLRYDGRGQGGGPRPTGGYELSSLVDDLEHLMKEHSIEKAYFIGLSNGGRIALEFASRHPSRVQGVIAADTYLRPSALLKRKLQSWLYANQKGGPLHRFDVATPWIWGETIVEERPELLEFYRQRAGDESVHVIEGLIKGAMGEHEINAQNISAPVLLCVGEEDVLTPPFSHMKMKTKIAHCELRIVAGGHASFLENPQSLKEVCLPWLLDQTKRKPWPGLSF